MTTYLSIGLFVGVFLGIIFVKYIIPILDIKLEEYTHKKSIVITEHQITAQSMLDEYSENKCEDEGGLTQAIGFQVDDFEDEYYDEDEDCEGDG